MSPVTGLLGGGFATHTVPEVWLSATVRAAAELAAGRDIAAVASVAVTTLARGALKAMLIGRLKFAATGVFALAAVIVGLAGAVGSIVPSLHPAPATAPADSEQGAFDVAAGGDLRINGLVVDPLGRPVGGARVSSLGADQRSSAVSKTDGTFVISVAEPRLLDVSLLATIDPGSRQGIFRFNDPIVGPAPPRTLVRIVLKPARSAIVSVVAARGQPVDGALVVFSNADSVVAQGRTDSRGIATITTPADAVTHWIFAYKAGFGFDYFENYPSTPTGLSPVPERTGSVCFYRRPVVYPPHAAREPPSSARWIRRISPCRASNSRPGASSRRDGWPRSSSSMPPPARAPTFKESRDSTGCQAIARAVSLSSSRRDRTPHCSAPRLRSVCLTSSS